MDEVFTDPELLAIVPEPSEEDFRALKKSMEEHGQLEPIIVWKDAHSGKPYIIDGHSRYKICKQLGFEPKLERKNFESWFDAIRYAINVNSNRRHLTPMQRVQIAFRQIEIEKQIALKRQKSTLPKKGQKGFQKMPNGIHTGNTCDIVSEKTGIPSRTVARYKKILDEGSADLIRKVISGKKTAAGAERTIKLEKSQTKDIPLPEGKYKVILCDAPYKYDYEGEGAPDYPTLSEEEIINLKDMEGRPVLDLFADDSVIFFWSPMPKLEEALRILQTWGFSYKTSIVWSKEKGGISQQGPGYYAIATCEQVLVATRGKPGVPLPNNRPLGILRAPRAKHSQKPEILRHWIEKMYPNEKYLELFARQTVSGWIPWGNQLDFPDVKASDTKGILDYFED